MPDPIDAVDVTAECKPLSPDFPGGYLGFAYYELTNGAKWLPCCIDGLHVTPDEAYDCTLAECPVESSIRVFRLGGERKVEIDWVKAWRDAENYQRPRSGDVVLNETFKCGLQKAIQRQLGGGDE